MTVPGMSRRVSPIRIIRVQTFPPTFFLLAPVLVKFALFLVVCVFNLTATGIDSLFVSSATDANANANAKGAPQSFASNDPKETRTLLTLTYETRFYENKVDHDDDDASSSPQTYRQRYLVNDTYYGKGRQNVVSTDNTHNDNGYGCRGPIWFYTGNEGSIEGFWSSNGFMQYLTVEYGGLLVMAEERYYGTSIPTNISTRTHGEGEEEEEDDHYNPYKFLSTHQILEDYVELLRFVKRTYGAESCPTIAFGGSYGGTLSAYLRAAYPDVVQGALASSAELFYYDLRGWESHGVTEFTFAEIIAQQYHDASSSSDDKNGDCLKAIWDAADAIDGTEPSVVMETFHFCDVSAMQPKPSSYFIYGLEGLPQQNYPYPVGTLPSWPVKAVCDILLTNESSHAKNAGPNSPNSTSPSSSSSSPKMSPSDLVRRAARVTALALEYSLNPADPCLETLPEGGPGNVPGDGPGVTAWGYQSCTETLHMFSSVARHGDHDHDLTRQGDDGLGLRDYTFSLRPFQDRCWELYGVVPNTTVLADRFGGFDLAETTTNTIFSSGALDPWGGATAFSSSAANDRGVYFFRMPNGAHHLDLRGWNEADPPDVTTTRRNEERILVRWIREHMIQNSGPTRIV